MSHRRKVWIVYALFLAVVVAAMGWASWTVLRLDRAHRESQRLAEREELVRLALWRMDAALSAVVAAESARPYFQYRSFHTTTDAYTRGYRQVDKGGVLIPSPLLSLISPLVLLHFWIDGDGNISSPQVPAGPMRALAVREFVSEDDLSGCAKRLEALTAALSRDKLLAGLPAVPPGAVTVNMMQLVASGNLKVPNRDQRARRSNELNARQAMNLTAQNTALQNTSNPRVVEEQEGPWSVRRRTVRDGEARSVWAGPNLLLARRTSVDGKTHVVGCWLDWAKIQQWLLANVSDLLPAARLEPVAGSTPQEDFLRLAMLRVRLVPGAVPVESGRGPGTAVISLAVAWAGIVLAAAAVSILLNGVLALSERRAAFASAVTHELRTPLTTIRMYTEMLSGGLVADEQKRSRYLATVHDQTNRLCRLVENVLSYSRLEGARSRGRKRPVAIGPLLAQIAPRLRDSAAQAGMELVVESDGPSDQARAATDPEILEQALANLVDNACKYAARAADKRIHVEVLPDGKATVLRVRDHGPGIPPEEMGRVFQPFFRARRDAAGSLGGAGLGLSIARRLLRSVGGELTIVRGPEEGAAFDISLPNA